MAREALSRRDFLKGGVRGKTARIRPPGIEAAALAACTGCGACIEHCPAGIIGLSDGLPALDFAAGECLFCGARAENCPEPVFTQPSAGFDHVVAIDSSCLAFRRIDCQACRDACPAGAIRFRPVRGGPFVPELTAEMCTGCGACIFVCPAGAVAPHIPEVTHA